MNNSGDYDEHQKEQEQKKKEKEQEDVNNLFATYMAQRKDKGFSDVKYSQNAGGSSSSDDGSIMSGSSGDNNAANENWNGGLGDMSSPSPSPTTSSSKGLGAKIPGLRRFLSTSETNETSKKVVQHIPLSSEKSSTSSSSSSSSNNQIDSSTTKPPNPPSLHEQDLLKINKNYQKFFTQMKDQLEELKIKNPNSIPDNANEILSQVIEEQKAYDMKEVTNQRALESFDEYYANRMREKMKEGLLPISDDGSNSNDGGDEDPIVKDPIVKEIVEEANKEQQFRMQQEEQYRKYKEYEESLRKQLKKNTSSNSNININSVSTNATPETSSSSAAAATNNESDFDEMQLKTLENLLQRRQQRSEGSEFEDEDLYLTDNIEDGIEELRQKNPK